MKEIPAVIAYLTDEDIRNLPTVPAVIVPAEEDKKILLTMENDVIHSEYVD